MTLKAILAVTALGTMATGAVAQNFDGVSFGAGVTNFGLSLEGEYTVTPQVGVRGMVMGGFSFDDEFDVDDATIDGEVDLGGVAVLADYYPLGNAWRLSGGLFFSTSEVTGTVTDGLVTYDGQINFKNEVAPLISTGFSTEVASGWSVSGDIGVIVSSLEVSSDDDTGTVQADIAELNADLEDVPVLPFIGVAVSYSY
ncbi:hypothetical protein AN191_00735 [Loktanella sp. 5RATIMAR09]|uniref:hypothetical protein n=1 Tax=Loktanella sp. 5RATIMAR09 TaxID=1225655 RepID=UPI0006EBB0F2|nr:hypothetical protein [Loktanella sp. 5RATIMAR09]KQI73461.1 hypothetical protein AN191_00735 [Loktanella sp. 5RATIMAR09]